MAGVLMLLPPSETKAPPPRRGLPVDLNALSFPELAPMRSMVLRALVVTSARRDALVRLGLGESRSAEVARNGRVLSLPARPVLEVYRGGLFAALDAASMSPAAKRRAASRVVVVSPLWGALRPVDRIPTYRLDICADLVGVGPLEPPWRQALGPVLTDVAGDRGVIVDVRSSSYRAVGSPTGLSDRTVSVRVIRHDRRGAAGAVSKRTRGEVVRHLLESGANPSTPEKLASALTDTWEVDLAPPARIGGEWTLTVVVPD
jgi:uncharacterized protein